MPKQDISPYIGDERKLNMLVQKSNPLLSLCQSDMTLEEFKILDIYLAHINSHDRNTKEIVFSQGEMEDILGVKRIRPQELRNRLRHLLGTIVSLGAESSSKEVKQIVLFAMAVSKKEANGRWYVTLCCTDEAEKYIFDIDTIGYVRYRIRKVVRLKSRYSYVLYMYLLHNAFRKSWTVPVEKLKKILCCEDIERYKQFKFLNSEILIPCNKELTEKECLIYTHETVKNWRTVTDVKFTVKDLLDSKVKNDPIEMAEADYEDYKEPEYEDNVTGTYALRMASFLSEACNNEFSEKEMLYLYSLLQPLELKHPNGPDIAKYHYLEELYLKMNARDNVSKRFPYLISMLKEDIKNKV